MVHGTLVVEGSVDTPAPPQLDPIPAQPEETPAAGPRDDDREAAATRAEIADLTRRVAVGALFTAPVLFAVMATELFKVDWVPAFLMNRWPQLALIAPVMAYTGWPIYRTGWLALRHRAADMNALITLGTSAAVAYSLMVTLAPTLLPEDVREVYFEAVGVILTLILLGRLFEVRAKAGTIEAIRILIGLQARTARVLRGGEEADIPIEEVAEGEIVVVSRREDPGRRRGAGGPLGGRRVDGHRRAHAPPCRPATLSSAPPSTRPGPSASGPPRWDATPCWPRSSAWWSRPRRPRRPSSAWPTPSRDGASPRSWPSPSPPSRCGSSLGRHRPLPWPWSALCPC